MTLPSIASATPAVKICGLVRPEDAESVNEAKPEYAGFVFFPKSKRCIDREEALGLRALLDPDIRCVGVFVDEDPDFVSSLYEDRAIDIAQLHGSESEGYIEGLRAKAPGIEIWKAFKVSSADDIAQANASAADIVLLDNGMGTGEAFDWSLISGMSRPFALAGGLSPETVAGALEACTVAGAMPVIVDVSSGVESAKLGDDGRSCKDAALIAGFVEAVRGA